MRPRIQSLLCLCLWLVSYGAQAGPGSTQPSSASSEHAEPRKDAKADGSLRDAQPEQAPRHDDMDAHVWRTWREMAVGLSALSLGYALFMDRRVADFENYPLEYRLRADSWRLDNNHLSVNYALHPLGGAVAYLWARAYHHGVWASAAYGLLSQTIWEFALEFKTRGSLNDVIVTPTAGIPIGEFLHQLGLYLDSAAAPDTATQIAQWSLGITRWARALLRAAGLYDPELGTLHRLRHTFASNLAGNGTDLETLRDLLEHHSVHTTETYLCLPRTRFPGESRSLIEMRLKPWDAPARRRHGHDGLRRRRGAAATP